MMKKSPEPIILAVALVLLAVGCALIAYLFPTIQALTKVTSTEPSGNRAVALKPADIEASLSAWNSPVIWQAPSDNHRLFDSDEYLFYPSVYPAGDYIKKIGPDTRSPSGIPLSWYKKYGLDFTDPNVDRSDTDGDGFTAHAEFVNDPVGVRQKAADLDGSKSTNPLDAKSHPEYLSRLRLKEFDLRPFHIQFKGYNQIGGKYVFQLHLDDVPSYNQPPMKAIGDQLGFEGYIIGPFNQIFKDETDPNTKSVTPNVDESTLELDKPEIDRKVILPFRKIINSPESTADFVMLMPSEVDKVIKISQGKIFTVPFIPDTSFRLIDTKDTGATIRDIKTNKDYFIPKLDPADWDDVPRVATPAP
jgi:hypothetical protein